MKKEVDKARRILGAAQQLHRIEQWRMADLERRLAELDEMQLELINALNDTNALHGLFIDATARRLSLIAEEAERVSRAKQDQSLKVIDHATRVKMCERLAHEHAQEFERQKEGKDLLETVERFLGRKHTSLP